MNWLTQNKDLLQSIVWMLAVLSVPLSAYISIIRTVSSGFARMDAKLDALNERVNFADLRGSENKQAILNERAERRDDIKDVRSQQARLALK